MALGWNNVSSQVGNPSSSMSAAVGGFNAATKGFGELAKRTRLKETENRLAEAKAETKRIDIETANAVQRDAAIGDRINQAYMQLDDEYKKKGLKDSSKYALLMTEKNMKDLPVAEQSYIADMFAASTTDEAKLAKEYATKRARLDRLAVNAYKNGRVDGKAASKAAFQYAVSKGLGLEAAEKARAQTLKMYDTTAEAKDEQAAMLAPLQEKAKSIAAQMKSLKDSERAKVETTTTTGGKPVGTIGLKNKLSSNRKKMNYKDILSFGKELKLDEDDISDVANKVDSLMNMAIKGKDGNVGFMSQEYAMALVLQGKDADAYTIRQIEKLNPNMEISKTIGKGVAPKRVQTVSADQMTKKGYKKYSALSKELAKVNNKITAIRDKGLKKTRIELLMEGLDNNYQTPATEAIKKAANTEKKRTVGTNTKVPTGGRSKADQEEITRLQKELEKADNDNSDKVDDVLPPAGSSNSPKNVGGSVLGMSPDEYNTNKASRLPNMVDYLGVNNDSIKKPLSAKAIEEFGQETVDAYNDPQMQIAMQAKKDGRDSPFIRSKLKELASNKKLLKLVEFMDNNGQYSVPTINDIDRLRNSGSSGVSVGTRDARLVTPGAKIILDNIVNANTRLKNSTIDIQGRIDSIKEYLNR